MLRCGSTSPHQCVSCVCLPALPSWVLVRKLAFRHGGREEPRGRGGPLRTGGWQFNKRGNLLWGLSWAAVSQVGLVQVARILTVCTEALTGVGHYTVRWSQQPIAPPRLRSWKQLPLWERLAGCRHQGREGEGLCPYSAHRSKGTNFLVRTSPKDKTQAACQAQREPGGRKANLGGWEAPRCVN